MAKIVKYRWALQLEKKQHLLSKHLSGALVGPYKIYYDPNGAALTAALFETRELARDYARNNRKTKRSNGFRIIYIPTRVRVTVETI